MISILPAKPQTTSSRLDSILTANEVAEILRISKAKAYQMIQRGEIPADQFD